MCYTNILQIIDLSGIPLFAKDRSKGDTLVIGGGPCTVNPEPMADFFDMFYIGEAETSYDELIELIKVYKKTDMTRDEFLRKASHIAGIYVPSLYEVAYNADGTVSSISPKYEDVPAKIKRQVVSDFSKVSYPMAPVIPYIQATQDRVCLEIMRGCIRGRWRILQTEIFLLFPDSPTPSYSACLFHEDKQTVQITVLPVKRLKTKPTISICPF